MDEVLQSMKIQKLIYKGIFPQTFTLLNVLLAIPVGTTTVERSFSQMKLIKTRLKELSVQLQYSLAAEDFCEGTQGSVRKTA